MTKFYVNVNYNGVVEAQDEQTVYDALPSYLHLDLGLNPLDYDIAEVETA